MSLDKLSKEQIQEIYKRILIAFKTDNPAKVARGLGIGRQAVYHWRDGKSGPSRERVLQISKITGRSINWLYTGEDDEESNKVVEFPRKEEGAGRDHEFEAKLLKRLRDKLKTAPPEQRDFIHKVIKMLLGEAQDKAVD